MNFLRNCTKPLCNGWFVRVVVYWSVLLLVLYTIRWEGEPEVILLSSAEEVMEPFGVDTVHNLPKRKARKSNVAAFDSIDINSASIKRLCSIKGIGPVLAERIVTYRNENGKFSSLDELDEVKGIGPKSVEKLKRQAVKVSR